MAEMSEWPRTILVLARGAGHMVVSRSLVESVQLAGIALGLIGTWIQIRPIGVSTVRTLAFLLYLALWGVVGAAAPINGWLFTGTQSVFGVPAFILNGPTVAGLMGGVYFGGGPAAARDMGANPGVVWLVRVLFVFLLVGIGYAAFDVASSLQIGLALTIVSVVVAVVAFVVAYIGVGYAAAALSDRFAPVAGLVGGGLIVLGLLVQLLQPVLDLLNVKIV
jgi:hypothetical protein